ncbi:MAG TPA: sigma 54-interacting transcriptional regulator [bacterium]|nr:sigma 54-interacting transcriptional regulator [bacterium]
MLTLIQQHEVFRQWKKFTAESIFDASIIRPVIAESWFRSREYSIDPENTGIPSVSSDQLKSRKELNRHLLSVASSYMETIYGFISGSGGIIVLADKDGVILHVLGENVFENYPGFPVPGSIFSEREAGTNAIGTCLAVNAPLEITSAEHFCKLLHKWNCSADIIRSDDGQTAGILAFFTSLDKNHSHTLSMVAASAGAIERQMKVENSLKEKLSILKLQNLMMNLIDEGIIVIDNNQTVKAINKQALYLLEIENENPLERSVYEVIRSGINFLHIISEGKDIKEREATLKLRENIKKFNISAAVIKNDSFSVEGLVITIRENKLVHNIVNRVSGSRAQLTFRDIIGESETLRQTIKFAKAAAGSSSNVLLLGESGTGKELFAQSIHNESSRSNFPFIAVNCGAIPRDLVESELFGYEGGAFTGSKKEGHPGKFELADGGTIFLDEIGDMPLDAQVDLLRVLENGEVVRVGGKHPKKINVRVIAATHVDLAEAVSEKTFRDDLFYRLNVLMITIPPLRERKDDIKPLTEFFKNRISEKLQKKILSIDDRTIEALYSYDWPGNIRELENVIERAVNVCESETITQSDLPSSIREKVLIFSSLDNTLSIKSNEFRHIVSILEKNKGNLRKSAIELGISRSTLYEKMKRYKISSSDHRLK